MVASEELSDERLDVGELAPLEVGERRLLEDLRQGDLERRLLLHIDGGMLLKWCEIKVQHGRFSLAPLGNHHNKK